MNAVTNQGSLGSTMVLILLILLYLQLSIPYKLFPCAVPRDHIKFRNLNSLEFYQPSVLKAARENLSLRSSVSLNSIDTLKNKLKGTCVYFVGIMGCGKTKTAEAFSKLIDYRFLDTDEIAEFMIEMPITEFFKSGNIEEFRQVEYKILMEMSQYTRLVISTGGGIVIKNENWGLLRHGLVVFIDVEPEVIYNRLKNDPLQIQKRPLLASAREPILELQKLHAERLEKYMQADVHIKVSSESSPDNVANDVIEGILHFIEKNPPLWESWKKKRENFAVEAAARVSDISLYIIYLFEILNFYSIY